MATEAPNPSQTHEEQLAEGELERTEPWPVEPGPAGCNEAEVMQSIDALEDGALKSFRDGGITNYDVRVVVHAAENARRALADGKTNPCRVVPDLVRDIMQSDVDVF